MKTIRFQVEDGIYRDARTLTLIDGDGGSVERYVRALLERRIKEMSGEVEEFRRMVRPDSQSLDQQQS